jgi:hypothetical protein
VVTGTLTVDLLDLTRTRGTIRADVASIEIGTADDTGDQRRESAEARNWLDVGSSQPEAVRERRRWAEFVIREIQQPSAPAAHAGRRLPGGAGTSELREVTCRAVGDLTLHGYRVATTADLRVRFTYPRASDPSLRPTRVEVETRTPVLVSLAVHDIRPRDASGVLLALDAKLVGSRVAREARVALRLVAGLRQ